MSNHHADYVYLGCHRWARRDAVSAALLEKYDRLYTIAEHSPGAVDAETGRSYGALWLDAVDQILERGTRLLGRVAVLEDQDLRDSARRRAFDAMVAPRKITRP